MQHPDIVHLKIKAQSLHLREALMSGSGRGREGEWVADVASWGAGAGKGVCAGASGPHEEATRLQHRLPLGSLDWNSNLGCSRQEETTCLAILFFWEMVWQTEW